MMLTELCHELNNWFDRKRFVGEFTVSGGQITSNDGDDLGLLEGQYFRIIGSVFNDGVHVYPAADLSDESFDGAVWTMAVPSDFIRLANEIEAWQAKYGAIDSQAMSPYTSESFGGYSYSKSSGSSSSGASSVNTWQSTFASRLNKYRKIRGV